MPRSSGSVESGPPPPRRSSWSRGAIRCDALGLAAQAHTRIGRGRERLALRSTVRSKAAGTAAGALPGVRTRRPRHSRHRGQRGASAPLIACAARRAAPSRPGPSAHRGGPSPDRRWRAWLSLSLSVLRGQRAMQKGRALGPGAWPSVSLDSADTDRRRLCSDGGHEDGNGGLQGHRFAPLSRANAQVRPQDGRRMCAKREKGAPIGWGMHICSSCGSPSPSRLGHRMWEVICDVIVFAERRLLVGRVRAMQGTSKGRRAQSVRP